MYETKATAQNPYRSNWVVYRATFKKYWRIVLTAFITLVITNFLDALPPLFVGMALDAITSKKPFGEVSEILVTMFVLVTVLAGVRFSWRMLWGLFSHAAAKDMQDKVFQKFLQLNKKYLSSNPVGEMVSLIANDVSNFRVAIGPGTILVMDAISIFFILMPLMWSISGDWTMKTLVLMPLIPFAMTKLSILVDTLFSKQQEKFSELSGFAQEIVSGIRVIKNFSNEDIKRNLFGTYSKKYEEACNRTARIDALFAPIMEATVSVGSFILLLIGVPEVIAGKVTIGSFFAFYQYIDRMVWPMSAIGFALSHIKQGDASLKRLRTVMQQTETYTDFGAEEVSGFREMEVRNLSFQYPNRSEFALRNLSFSLRSGQSLGVVGPTGSGKSTLIDLLCRLSAPTGGTIFINGVPIENLKLGELRDLISVVPQDTFLFSEQIGENISLGRTMDRIEIERLAKVVDLHEEIQSFPHGYQTYLGERGVNLSGGQKQRLAIARAFAKRGSILILDDSLSAVDAKTEKIVESQVRNELAHERAAIVISHRINSVKWCDQILVLNNGHTEAIGTHDQCLAASETYRHLFELQKEGLGDVPALH